jgi:DNA polymerase-3 subunit epsilon
MGLFDRLISQRSAGSQSESAVPMSGFVVLDVETTGLSPIADRVVEVAVVRTDSWGRNVGEWSSRLNPGRRVTATHIHGLTQADVADAPAFADVVPTFE